MFRYVSWKKSVVRIRLQTVGPVESKFNEDLQKLFGSRRGQVGSVLAY